MKKIIPALMLLTVVTLSFAFRPAPAQKAATDTVYKFVGGAWSLGEFGDETACDAVPEEFCAITFDHNVISPEDAQALAEEADPSTYSNGQSLGSTVKVYIRSEEETK